MLQQITVRVELGPYTLVGREVEALDVRQAVGAHAQCVLHFMRDPKAVKSPVAKLRLAELAGASLRVIFIGNASAEGGGSECLTFDGTVRDAEIEHLATGAGEVTVVALSNSYVLAEHADRRYFREQTVGTLAGTLGVRVAGSLPAGEARDYVQAGVSDWALLAQVAAEEGLQLRARWPRTPDGAADEHAEVGQGFADESHTLTWGRELQRLATGLAPTNAGVTGAFYDWSAKHDHRFRGVRAQVEWLGGAKPVVAAAREASTADADGGDPGHLEPGRLGGTRARTLAEFRDRLELASARRLGTTVRARGVSVLPSLRAGDRIEVTAAELMLASANGEVANGSTSNGSSGGGASSKGASANGASTNGAGDHGEVDDRTGTFGLIAVTHRWTGTLYQNEFEATPWAAYHPEPVVAAGPDEAAYRYGTLSLAVVTANNDTAKGGRVKVRYPWMADGESTNWIRVAGLGGGNGRGVGVLPEVDDEVVVGNIDGDPEHRVVVGTLWNISDRPGHSKDRQHWVTKSGSGLSMSEGQNPGEQVVELHTPGGSSMIRFNAKKNLVTIHSEGDLAIEAPKGELRIHAKRMTTQVDTDSARTVKGKSDDHVTGAITVECEARIGMKGATVDVVSKGALTTHATGPVTAHAGGPHTITGSPVSLNP